MTHIHPSASHRTASHSTGNPVSGSVAGRRSFLVTSARLLGGATLLGPLLAACGSDDSTGSAGTGSAGTGASTPAGGSSTDSGSTPAGSLGTVRTAFNWQPDVEWASWYLADSMGLFSANGVTTPFVHGGPNTPAVAQVLAAGDADVGVASDELQLIQANKEGADFVILGAMYQRSPSGYVWLADTPIETAEDLVGKKIGLTTGDEIRVDALFKVNGLEPDYERIAMSFDPQPLIDGDADVITCYVTNQPIQLELQGIANKSAPFSDFGLKAYGDVLFASKAYVEANRDLLVAYFAGLLGGVAANVADPEAVLPLLATYGPDADIDLTYSKPGNAAYIALLDSDFTEANGLLSIDPAYLENEVYPSYEAAGEADLPPVGELLDTTVMADAQQA
jgi:ABC-type nitrate/sulfonate/bicarbonate transport system substrate-binding protein